MTANISKNCSTGRFKAKPLSLFAGLMFLAALMRGWMDMMLWDEEATSTESAKPGPSQLQCPLAAQQNAGLFKLSHNESNSGSSFQDVILVVACNYAYYDLLQNWEYLANQLNLKWAVLALDEDLYNVLGPERAISPDHDFSVSGKQEFQQNNFNKLSCNKMRMVLSTAEHCNLDVVFTDVDNIFYHNPFLHDLGRLIQSKRYDYLYQSNHPSDGPRASKCLQGTPNKAANTGFYYLNRHSTFLKETIENTLTTCADPANEFDDQTVFWGEVWKQKNQTKTPFHNCNLEEYLDPTTPTTINNDAITTNTNSEDKFNLCCLDPYYYPIGKPAVPLNPDPITYHANYCIGKKLKLERLYISRADHQGWNESRVVVKNEHIS